MEKQHLVLLSALLCVTAGSPFARAAELETASKASDPELSTATATADEEEGTGPWRNFSLNYVNIFYGPSVSNPTSYQPDPNGNPDTSRPVYTKNFLSLGYAMTENVALTGTMYFQWQPVLGQQVTMMDPFARISHASILNTDWGLNVYSDARVHFGVTNASRQADMITGLQNFTYVSWEIARSRLTAALRISSRYNVYGRQGAGTDAEFYLAPELIYQLAPTFALTALYEMGSSHQYGQKLTSFTNDGTDFEPGFSWDITPSLNFNPYLNIYTGGKVIPASTSVGAFVSWNIL